MDQMGFANQDLPTVSYNLGRLDKLVHQQLSEALKPLGVSLPQFTILSHLARRGAESARYPQGRAESGPNPG